MLQKINRLPAKSPFPFYKTHSFLYFTAKVAKTNLSKPRFGFIVSKKIDKRATIRNKIKRVFRSVIEENIANVKPGLDILFILKKETCFCKTEDLRKNILSFMSKEQLI